MKQYMTYWLTAALALIPTLFLSAAEPEAGGTPPVVPPEVPAARTLRVVFANRAGSLQERHIAVTGSPETGYVNVFASNWVTGPQYGVSAGKMKLANGLPSPWGIAEYKHEACGMGFTADTSLASDETVKAYWPHTLTVPNSTLKDNPVKSEKFTDIGGGTGSYVLGAPLQFRTRTGGGSCDFTLTGVSPGRTYQLVLLGGRPNSQGELSTVTYSIPDATLLDKPEVLAKGSKAADRIADSSVQIAVPGKGVVSGDFWALIKVSVRPNGNTLTVRGTQGGNFVALSVTETAMPELIFSSAFQASDEESGTVLNKTASDNKVVNIFRMSTKQGGTGGFTSEIPMKLKEDQLKTADNRPSPWTVEIGPNRVSDVYGLKITGVDAALMAKHFDVPQKRLVGTYLAATGDIVGSANAKNGGCVMQNDYESPWVKFGNTVKGKCYEVTALVGRANYYNDPRAVYRVTGGTVLSANVLAEDFVAAQQKPAEVTDEYAIAANSAPVSGNEGVWSLMRFRVLAEQTEIALESKGVQKKSCGNYKALKIREVQAFDETAPMMLSFITRAKAADSFAGEAFVVVSTGEADEMIRIPDEDATTYTDGRFTNLKPENGKFYCNAAGTCPMMDFGQYLSVNGQLKDNSGWSVDVPMPEMDADKFLAAHNRVMPTFFTVNADGNTQANTRDFQYKIELRTADRSKTLAETEWIVSPVLANRTVPEVSAAVLKKTATSVRGRGLIVRFWCRSKDVGTFCGLQSLRFDRLNVPETVTVSGKEEPVSDALRNAVYAAAGVETDLGEVTIVPGKVFGKPMTADQMNNAVELFDGIVVKQGAAAKTFASEAAASAPAVFEVGYDFGIADMAVSGDMLTVTVGLQGPTASEASLKPGVTVQLLKDDGTDAGAAFDAESMTLTLENADFGGTVPRFRIRAVKTLK